MDCPVSIVLAKNVELGFHCGVWTQPDNNDASRSSFSRPRLPLKYLGRLPGGNCSPRSVSWTGTSKMLPSEFGWKEKTCFGLAVGMRTRLRSSTVKVIIRGNSHSLSPDSGNEIQVVFSCVTKSLRPF